MQLRFDVGEKEKHEVIFRFNQFWGNLSIAVDGRTVIRDFRLFSLRLVKTYSLAVGDIERHVVRIEKTRPVALAGYRPQQVRAYVDGALVAEGTT